MPITAHKKLLFFRLKLFKRSKPRLLLQPQQLQAKKHNTKRVEAVDSAGKHLEEGVELALLTSKLEQEQTNLTQQ